MKFQTISNFDPKRHAGERCVGKSMTVPDQTLPLRVLVDRYTSGQFVHTYEGVYDDAGFEMPDLRSLDLTEVEELMSASRDRIKELRAAMKKAKAKSKLEQNPFKQQSLEFNEQEVKDESTD